ncbi:hypothetical protein R3W88_027220 [Solanum pinnatisectum]|uniref:S-protein homolog n=1 Tax=Solanum pinnatisectum TaxID=50273 RepID=A0AAV9LFN5_9SOLN|nr:hypothetical protein R3W88_027220 [Solanum pinnatisectum]
MGQPSFITIILLLLLFVFPLGLIRGCFLYEKYQVQIIDDLPSDSPQLKLLCASKQDDFGIRFLSSTQNFTWSFCEDLLDRTLYFCHFWWDSNDRVFDVFNDPWSCIHGGHVNDYINTCVWVVRPEGFYLGKDHYRNGTLKMYKVYDWGS